MLPALVAEQLRDIAREHHEANPDGPPAARIAMQLGAIIPRVMFPGSWASAERHAGAEPLWTGRHRVYDESTLRHVAERLDREGASERVRQAMWRSVTEAVHQCDAEVIGYTDMFDQALYTKKLAHAGPIGRLGNRVLGATYFGLTTVALPQGPVLFMHLSWHKAASPLRDGLEDLFDDASRHAWWTEHVWLHVIDRGANGDPVLSWMVPWDVPYLTIGRGSAPLRRHKRATARNDLGLPFVVLPDPRVGGDVTDGPWVVIAPADPTNADEVRGIRFRTNVDLSPSSLLSVNALYKSRWAAMENLIKSLQARGFGLNRSRGTELTISRGTEGESKRLDAREAKQLARLQDIASRPASASNIERVIHAGHKLQALRAEQQRLESDAPQKNSRVRGGLEWLGKCLHLLTHNALATALYASPDPSVRVMDVKTVYDLLLGHAAMTCVEDGRMTLWVRELDAADDKRRQRALVEVLNKLGLKCRGHLVAIHLHAEAAGKRS